ncbi:MAG TPA: cob(I)yrinic acid a,c-diamide adenosyltransferase [Acidimicrobiia bacterium]|jgi:cob(I)alamin adenosyltransferase
MTRSIYTKTGDDGTTGLFFGGRVRKDDPRLDAVGTLDEAQAALGVVRGLGGVPEIDDVLVGLESGLYVAMAELATSEDNRGKLKPEETLVSMSMVERLETLIDDFAARFTMPTDFVIPGGSPASALLDQARTVVRRAERRAVEFTAGGSEVGRWLNRLSDLLWVMARWQEGESRLAKDTRRSQ